MTTASAKKDSTNKVHTPEYISVKMQCVVCKHNWVATIAYGPMPNYVDCPECAKKMQEQ